MASCMRYQEYCNKVKQRLESEVAHPVPDEDEDEEERGARMKARAATCLSSLAPCAALILNAKEAAV
jgi:hypothetical protein